VSEDLEHTYDLSFAKLKVTNLSVLIRALELSLELVSGRLLVTSASSGFLRIFLQLSHVQGTDVLSADFSDLLDEVLGDSLHLSSVARSQQDGQAHADVNFGVLVLCPVSR